MARLVVVVVEAPRAEEKGYPLSVIIAVVVIAVKGATDMEERVSLYPLPVVTGFPVTTKGRAQRT